MNLLFWLILQAIQIYTYVLIANVIMSWIPSLKESAFGRVISKLADPYLDFFRKWIPPLGMIDLSPIVAILTLGLISQGIVTIYGMLFA